MCVWTCISTMETKGEFIKDRVDYGKTQIFPPHRFSAHLVSTWIPGQQAEGICPESQCISPMISAQTLKSFMRVKHLLAGMVGLDDGLFFGGWSGTSCVSLWTSFLSPGTPESSSNSYIAQVSMQLIGPRTRNGRCVSLPSPAIDENWSPLPFSPSCWPAWDRVWAAVQTAGWGQGLRVREQQGERSTSEPSHQPCGASWNY